MAISEPVPDEVPEAEVRIPTAWLMPWLDLETVRQAQRADSLVTITSDWLSLRGVEIIVERRWLRESFWRQIKNTVTRGYILRSTAVQVVLRGDRRDRDRDRDRRHTGPSPTGQK